ncbi:hypothetical protein D9V67_00860 [Buchnera aphidicola (Brachycaudus cardui)]|uniref:Colicin V production protein n=1 Tax=Buchnera aphidicola (Brachycaudus cardui) TaxID=557993 RepID=A0A4D6Y3B1_9GAMM|nr:CvpA family protein [Buchnera aphidicola]QCI20321.1 hypothetical protein D9V67_00860 [Buchnera aphidicola (Brachycaudus cardui)]
MFLIDYIIVFTVFISIFLGLSRGFLQEFISSFFWFFNFYFFYKYYYFSSFYINAFQDIFFKNKILILIIFFFIIKKILNYGVQKIIKKINLVFLNIILGGLFGIFRSFILVFLFLLIFKHFSSALSYYTYIQSSFLINVFFKITYFFINL